MNLFRAKKCWIFLLPLLVLCREKCIAETPVLVIKNSTSPINMGPYLQFIIDSNADANINKISSSNEFINSNMDIPNITYGDKPVWYKSKIVNQSGSDQFIINVANPALDEIDFYYPDSGNNYQAISYGEIKPFDQRKYNDPDYIFDLQLAQGDSITVFFKLKSLDINRFPVSIGTPDVIYNVLKQKGMILSLYIGLMLVMLLYNLFIYFTVRDNSYLYYVAYIISVLITQINVFGIPFQYLWPNSPFFEQIAILIFPILSGVTGMAFMQNFLQSRQFIPKFNKVSYLLYFGYIVSIGCIFINKYAISFQLTQLIAMLVALFMLISAYAIMRKGFRPAKFFLIAWSMFLLGIVFFVLSDTGVMPYSNFTLYTMPVGSGIEVILLSFALGDRINALKKEKEESQVIALETAKENERIIREQNVMLETKVIERTVELKEANDELNKTLIDLKEAQSQIVESEKMASLGQLTAGIAHEINNPINFVSSNVKPLQRDVGILINMLGEVEDITLGNKSNEEKKRDIDNLKSEYDFEYLREEIDFLLKGIADGSSRTANIVKGLRIFSRVDEDDLKRADVNEGIDSTIIILNNSLNGKIRIVKDYGDIPLAECYPGKLNQVFLNLISNAIYAIKSKYKEDNGGEIFIHTTYDEKYIFITVKDNGVGMDKNTLKKLFEPFFTTKPVGEGTGLGLSISYNTIKKHNGSITVQSTLGVGTAFTIQIPITHSN